MEAQAAATAVVEPSSGEAGAAAAAARPPRKPPQRGKAGGRTVVKSLRLSLAEAEAIGVRQQAAGLSFNAYACTCMLGEGGPKRRRRPTIDREALMTATAELNRVGNNLNQLARAINQGRDADELAETLAELRATATAIREALQR